MFTEKCHDNRSYFQTFKPTQMPESNSFSRTIRNGQKQRHVQQIFVIVEKRSVKKHVTDSKRKLQKDQTEEI